MEKMNEINKAKVEEFKAKNPNVPVDVTYINHAEIVGAEIVINEDGSVWF
jgi:hypothetical protein